MEVAAWGIMVMVVTWGTALLIGRAIRAGSGGSDETKTK